MGTTPCQPTETGTPHCRRKTSTWDAHVCVCICKTAHISIYPVVWRSDSAHHVTSPAPPRCSVWGGWAGAPCHHGRLHEAASTWCLPGWLLREHPSGRHWCARSQSPGSVCGRMGAAVCVSGSNYERQHEATSGIKCEGPCKLSLCQLLLTMIFGAISIK
jgi:hypothetical protein